VTKDGCSHDSSPGNFVRARGFIGIASNTYSKAAWACTFWRKERSLGHTLLCCAVQARFVIGYLPRKSLPAELESKTISWRVAGFHSFWRELYTAAKLRAFGPARCPRHIDRNGCRPGDSAPLLGRRTDEVRSRPVTIGQGRLPRWLRRQSEFI
jgi:hypothetical protein